MHLQLQEHYCLKTKQKKFQIDKNEKCLKLKVNTKNSNTEKKQLYYPTNVQC